MRRVSSFGQWQRVLLAVFGAGSFGAGVAAVFLTSNGTGSGVLVGLGGTVVVLALLGDRIESMEFGGSKLRLRAAAAAKFALAEDSEQRGDSAAAAELRAQGQELMDLAGPIAADYRAVRSSMPSGRDRTVAMQRVVARARQLATEQQFERAEVARWLQEGSDEERITALAMMLSNPELRHFDSVLAAIRDSRSAFEQYHALLVAEQLLLDLGPRDRIRLATTIRAVRDLRFRRDSSRWDLSERILAEMAADGQPHPGS
jgi:hypothetical protein